MRGNGIDWDQVQLRLGLKGGAIAALGYLRRCEIQRARLHGTSLNPADIDQAIREEHPADQHGPMWHPAVRLPDDDRAQVIGHAYFCLQAGVDGIIMLGHDANWRNHHEFLQLVAQAQSALRVGLDYAGAIHRDSDQELVFTWLKDVAREKQIKIHGYMELNFRADPRDHEGLTTKLYAYPPVVKKTRALWWDRLRTSAAKITSGAGDRRREEWVNVAVMVQNLLTIGSIEPDNTELVAILKPLKDHAAVLNEAFPMALGGPSSEVLSAFHAAWEEPSGPAQDTESAPRPLGQDAARVARALNGRVVLFIGGEPQEEARRRLEVALGLRELRWVETRKHKTAVSDLEPAIARPEVALVVLLAYTDHGHAEILRRLCAKDGYDKPLVQMPASAGFGIDRIAREIILQAGRDLGIGDP